MPNCSHLGHIVADFEMAVSGEEITCEVKAQLLSPSVRQSETSQRGSAARIIKRLNKKSEYAIM